MPASERFVCAPVLAGVAPHDGLHGRVGFQGRGIDRHRFARQQFFLGGQRQHPLEHGRVYFRGQTIADTGQTGVVGRLLRQRNAQKLPQGKAVGASPRDAALRADALVIADQQHAKGNARRNGRPAEMGVIVRLTHLLDRAIKVRLRQQPVEFPVENVSCRFRQACGGHPHFLLFLSMFSPRHRHSLLRHAMATFLFEIHCLPMGGNEALAFRRNLQVHWCAWKTTVLLHTVIGRIKSSHGRAEWGSRGESLLIFAKTPAIGKWLRLCRQRFRFAAVRFQSLFARRAGGRNGCF